MMTLIRRHPFLYSSVVILILWSLMHFIAAWPFIPSPIKTLGFILTHAILLLSHLSISLLRVFTSILLAVFVGGLTGIIIAKNKKADQWITPLVYALYPVPKIAFLPIIMLLFGLGNTSKVILIYLILFFQITLSVRDSVHHIHPLYYLSIKSLGADKKDVYRHVVMPAILPNLFTTLRISIGTAISVLFFAENYATKYGIGYFIMDQWLKMNYSGMFAGIIVIGTMGVALFLLLDYLEKKFCPWKAKT